MSTIVNSWKTAVTVFLSLFSLTNFGQVATSTSLARQRKAFPQMNQNQRVNLGTEAAGADSKQQALGGTAGVNHALASKVSILCFKDPDQNQITETMEDIAVLAFLLSRDLEHTSTEDESDYKMGIPMLLTAGSQVGASYIQGFGAILKLQVPFPLVDSPNEAPPADTAQATSEWDRARQELIAKDDPTSSYWATHSARSNAEPRGQPYDSKLVETFKNRLLLSLKNASNLRHLDGSEWIMVKVIGSPIAWTSPISSALNYSGSDAKIPSGQFETQPDNLDDQPTVAYGATAQNWFSKRAKAQPFSNQPTVLTVRIRKSAADQFAAGSLSKEQFLKDAESAAYLNPAQQEAETRLAK